VAPYPLIGDYAVLGDCRSAALVCRDGGVDWLCLPHFDSPPVFAALLDHARGGRFRIGPVASYEVGRRYHDDSAVLETTFRTDAGAARVTDALTVASPAVKRRRMWPDRELLRVVEGISGAVELEIWYEPRYDYGQSAARLHQHARLGIACERRGKLLLLRSEVPLEIAADGSRAIARVRVRAGERFALSLVFAFEEPAILAPLGDDALHRIELSVSWWRGWVQHCTYDGHYRSAVLRSLVTLKLMTFAPSGAIVAAPTTSLPEQIGGERNWDYRYCWMRDASMTLRSLFDLGYREEAAAFLHWLLHTTRPTRPRMDALYDVHGRRAGPEHEIDLDGYAGSRPVRVGNGARGQLQLDTYGEVLDAVFEFVRRGGEIDPATQRLVIDLGQLVCERWREPDEGIWEIRSGRRHHTTSKVLCWVALDRLIAMRDAGKIQRSIGPIHRVRDEIRADVERQGVHPRLGCYVSHYGADDVDASLLLLPIYGYVPFRDAVVLRTTEVIHDRLCKRGVIHRYLQDDGIQGSEGAFGICSFWYVICRAQQGRLEDATAHFERLLDLANDVGLFGEEVEPDSGIALGNFPQAFTHVGLIDAALTLAQCTGERRRPEGRAEGRVV